MVLLFGGECGQLDFMILIWLKSSHINVKKMKMGAGINLLPDEQGMRNRESWMNRATDPVLELLAESGLALSPGVITYNLHREMTDAPSRSSITRAINELEAHNFIHKPPGSKTYYEITDHGRAYLEGNIGGNESE